MLVNQFGSYQVLEPLLLEEGAGTGAGVGAGVGGVKKGGNALEIGEKMDFKPKHHYFLRSSCVLIPGRRQRLFHSG
jgi:hypothetical protein